MLLPFSLTWGLVPRRGAVPGEAALGYVLSFARPGDRNNSASKNLLLLDTSTNNKM